MYANQVIIDLLNSELDTDNDMYHIGLVTSDFLSSAFCITIILYAESFQVKLSIVKRIIRWLYKGNDFYITQLCMQAYSKK